jgi:hypothetical protein
MILYRLLCLLILSLLCSPSSAQHNTAAANTPPLSLPWQPLQHFAWPP